MRPPRDPSRIPQILARLQRAWEACPDMRLGQLILVAPGDLFNIEDEELLIRIERVIAPEQKPSRINQGWQGQQGLLEGGCCGAQGWQGRP